VGFEVGEELLGGGGNVWGEAWAAEELAEDSVERVCGDGYDSSVGFCSFGGEVMRDDEGGEDL
jgi:hypothetical protein